MDEPKLVARRVCLGLVLPVVVQIDGDRGSELGPPLEHRLAEFDALQVVHAPMGTREGVILRIGDAQRVVAVLEPELGELGGGRGAPAQKGDGDDRTNGMHASMYHAVAGADDSNMRSTTFRTGDRR